MKVGDTVKLTAKAEKLFDRKESYVIAEIYTDGFGSVALQSIGGYGYGTDYLEVVTLPTITE